MKPHWEVLQGEIVQRDMEYIGTLYFLLKIL